MPGNKERGNKRTVADTKVSISDCKKKINDEVISYLRQSETSGNTPTEEQFMEFGERLVAGVVDENKSLLSQNDQIILLNTLDNYFKTEMLSKYQRSLREHPRTVNGEDPVTIDDNNVKNYEKVLKEEKNALIKDIKYLMKESERTNRTPNRQQALSWLMDQMDEDLAGWTDEQGKRYVISYIQSWIGNEYDKREAQSRRNHPRKENGHWPWKTDEQEQKEKEEEARAKAKEIEDARKSGKREFSDYKSVARFASDFIDTYHTFSGHDMVCTVEMPLPKGGTYTQVIGELQTITYSIHQEKGPVRCLGDMNAKGYIFGPRTIAGTMIFTVFDKHWTTKMEAAYLENTGVNAHMLADELPPFNFTISCANEYEHDAVCSIFGITLVNEGQVMSINDVYTENTFQFYAADIQYLAPVKVSRGGMKLNTSDIPEINKSATPTSVKPTPQEKQPLPAESVEETNPDPEKPSIHGVARPSNVRQQKDVPEEEKVMPGEQVPGQDEKERTDKTRQSKSDPLTENKSFEEEKEELEQDFKDALEKATLSDLVTPAPIKVLQTMRKAEECRNAQDGARREKAEKEAPFPTEMLKELI